MKKITITLLTNQHQQFSLTYYHSHYKKIILNIKASNTTDFPVTNAFHTFDLRKILTDLPSGYGEKNINLIYEFYGSNNQAVKIIKLVQIINLFLLYVKKKNSP